ncbi:MAG: hypothetical protein GEV08_24945, partial [Acidimicrobiia bacterium]|nr:hypothetical protein [Acidimicrobiia bacterium]
MLAVVLIQTVVILVLGVLVAGLLRSHAEILRALHRLGAGEGDVAVAGPRSLAPRPATGASAGEAAFDVGGTDPWGSAVHVGVAGT